MCCDTRSKWLFYVLQNFIVSCWLGSGAVLAKVHRTVTLEQICIHVCVWVCCCRFSNKESAGQAICGVHGQVVNEQQVKCSWGKESNDTQQSQSSTPQMMGSQSVRISAIPPRFPAKDLVNEPSVVRVLISFWLKINATSFAVFPQQLKCRGFKKGHRYPPPPT